MLGSVLFVDQVAPEPVAEPDHFADLNLDRLATAVTGDDPFLLACFRHQSRDPALVRFWRRCPPT